jgi:hypothetical protein
MALQDRRRVDEFTTVLDELRDFGTAAAHPNVDKSTTLDDLRFVGPAQLCWLSNAGYLQVALLATKIWELDSKQRASPVDDPPDDHEVSSYAAAISALPIHHGGDFLALCSAVAMDVLGRDREAIFP